MTMFKVSAPKVQNFKRETWIDLSFPAPGGLSWVDAPSPHSDDFVVPSSDLLNAVGGKLYNMSANKILNQGDPAYSRINWQPVFTMESLPGLEDLNNLFRLFKLQQISMTLFPQRQTNPIKTDATAGDNNIVAPNVILTTMYAKTGMNRLYIGGEDLAQVERKNTKLYNTGIGNKKLGWYFKPKCNALDFKNPKALITPTQEVSIGGSTVTGVDLVDCFSFTVKAPQWAPMQQNLDQEYFGPLISMRSVDGRSMLGGTNALNNFTFRCRFTYYFSCKATK